MHSNFLFMIGVGLLGVSNAGPGLVQVRFKEQEQERAVDVELQVNEAIAEARYRPRLVVGADGRVKEALGGEVNKACHFIGSVRGEPTSTVAASACNEQGIVQGSIFFNNGRVVEFEVDPERQGDSRLGRVLESSAWTTDIEVRPKLGMVELALRAGTSTKQNSGKTLVVPNNELFLEILIVSDPARISKFKNFTELTDANFDIVNGAQALYNRLNETADGPRIQLAVVGQIFWSDEPFLSTTEMEAALTMLNQWRRENLETLPLHDALHLLSGKEYDGQTVGIAHVGSVCDQVEYCGRVSEGNCQVISGALQGCCFHGAASITRVSLVSTLKSSISMAHELGHQLGFVHNEDDNSCAKSGSFLMNAVIPAVPDPRVSWSACSRETFASNIKIKALPSGFLPYQCLVNKPGKGIVSPGALKGSSAPGLVATLLYTLLLSSALLFL